MGVPVSRPNKICVGSLKTKTDEKKIQDQNLVTESRPNVAERHSVRLSNDGVENNSKTTVGLRYVPVVVNNTTNRPKFYYYPKKKESSTNETIFLPTSQFPYKKAKAVYVRQRNAGLQNTVASNQVDLQQYHGTYDDKWRIRRHENGVAGASDAQNDRLIFRSTAKPSYRLQQTVNDRRWSISHVLPTSNYRSDNILPHRTVAELRRSSISSFDADANFLTREELRRHSVEIEPGVNRPPTPSPTAWYPPRRTGDYLMASSLLASERQIDRRMAIGRDVHDF